MRNTNESGIAMITVLLVLMLMSALLVGFTTVVMSDQRYRFIDRDRGQAFYAASAGVEKLTADLGNLFLENVAPTAVQVTALTAAAKKPSISGITFAAATAPAALPASQLTPYHCGVIAGTKTVTLVGTNGYTITFCGANATGNPTVSDDALVITGTGAYSGMTALQAPYQIDVTAKTSTGGEVHLIRTLQAVSIPVFQFMMFSDSDLSFFAGAPFGFGGRVHTNGNLWLAEGTGSTLQTTGRVTAAKDVIRQFLSNGASINPNWLGDVSLATSAAAPAGNRLLLATEGSVTGMPPPASGPYANWGTVSLGATPANYNGFLRNGPTGVPLQPGTGAKTLSLPLTAPGVVGCVPSPCTNVEIVRRPLVGEPTTDILFNERLFTKASLRILLSDTAADITNLPGISAGAPVFLDGDWTNVAAPPVGRPAGYVVDATHPPIARSLGPLPAATTIPAALLANAATITVNAMPAMFVKPQLTFKQNAAGGNIKGPFTCTGWTETTFTGCVHTALTVANQPRIYISNAGAVPELVGNMPGNLVPPILTLGADSAANANITLAAGQTTWAFAANTFWVNDVGAGGTRASTLVTCAGANGAQFSGCTGVPATVAGATVTTSYLSNQNIGTIGGYIKIERQNVNSTIAAPSWTDVTMEILNYGIGAPNAAGFACLDPTPTAIVRLQRLRDNGGTAACPNPASLNSYEWWPNVLFDAREALQRDSNYPGANNLTLGGVMHYVNIDAGNLARWFKHNTAPFNVAGSTGNLSKVDGTGFTVYFSDRRNNRNAAVQETGEYGWEDFVNPLVANGVPNGTLQTGEDVNENTTLEVYGGIPNYTPAIALGVPAINTVPPPNSGAAGASSPLDNTARPTTTLLAGQAQVNRAILFRRALMLSNGAGIGANAVVADRLTGLTVVSENPVYIRGNWNAEVPAGAGFGGVNAASAVIADAVTLLSNQWTDAISFAFPYVATSRNATAASWYRLAIIGGKGPSFPAMPVAAGIAADFGTDGGAHNFLRFLEDFSGQTVNYLGSLATLYYNRQAVGTYKCCTTVYGAPTRAYNFDVNFLNPALLPPNTPMFRDMNVIGFSQELRPGR